MNIDLCLKQIKEHVKKIEYLRYTNNGLLYWDKITQMPTKGNEYRSEVMAYIAGQIHSLSQDERLLRNLAFLEKQNPDDLSIRTNSMLRKIKRNYKYTYNIPVEEYKAYIHLISKAEEAWAISKKENNFEMLEPFLEKIVCYFRKFADYWGYENEPYDALLEYYEEGMTVKKIDAMFIELRNFIIDYLKKINGSKENIVSFDFNNKFIIDNQINMTNEILSMIGFDFEAGRVDQSIHPTILTCSNKDVRIVTNYDKNDFRKALTTALHEGGQGLYEQGIDDELYGSFLAESASMSILEAIADYYENIFGKSEEFLFLYYPKLIKYFGELENISEYDFYRSLNKVEPTFIRMDADELTYNLHIIIRYEIEKDLINGKIEVKDVKEIWNRKYKDYLGIEPPNDNLGILQDVHWFSGYFGYFPIYVLGNLYATQIYEKLKSEKTDYREIISEGRWIELQEWFKEKIFSHGATWNSEELIYLVTDENLKVDYFINYLKEKYDKIYNL